MIRCESIGCLDEAFHDCRFFDYEGHPRSMILCDFHAPQLMRHSWYQVTAYLYLIVITDEMIEEGVFIDVGQQDANAGDSLGGKSPPVRPDKKKAPDLGA